jgi:tRNA(fMet)-specific endonuclease VapC
VGPGDARPGEKQLILDTNALSAAAEEHAGVMGILAGVQQLALPVVVIGEYRYGIAQSRHRARYRRWLDGLISDCTVLDVTERTTHHYVAINVELRQAGKPIPTNDLWIAALCRQHGLPLLSRDRHFNGVPGIQRLDW